MNTRLVVSTTHLKLPDAASAPAALLDLLPPGTPLTWVRRGDGIVGWGETASIRTSGDQQFTAAEARWNALTANACVTDEVQVPGTGLVAFGSFSFDPASPAGGVLTIPQVVLGRRGQTAWVTTIRQVTDLTDTPAADTPATGIQPTGTKPAPAPTAAELLGNAGDVVGPGNVTYSPGALPDQDWCAAVENAVTKIRAGELDKVVLARDVQARTEHPLDPRWPLQRLANEYAGCWTFSVDGLLGATPELLVRSEKGLVISRVLAGTVRRTGDDDADLAHAAHLSHSSKDLEEHEYAVASVADALTPFCSSTNVPEAPFVLHLPNVMHLATDVTGVLAHGASSLALAAALHPTAAVCGTPTGTARELIRDIEGLDRARYAGPVGWLSADGDGEWGIALRSAELHPTDNRALRLFAGCGIVAASVPAEELAETEAKLEPMRHALRS